MTVLKNCSVSPEVPRVVKMLLKALKICRACSVQFSHCFPCLGETRTSILIFFFKFCLLFWNFSISLHLGNEPRLVSFPSELPLMKPWLWCLWGFHCCTGIFVFWCLYFNWKMDIFSSYWMCREPKSWTKAWSTGDCVSLGWFSSDFIHVSFTLVKADWLYFQLTLVNV